MDTQLLLLDQVASQKALKSKRTLLGNLSEVSPILTRDTIRVFIANAVCSARLALIISNMEVLRRSDWNEIVSIYRRHLEELLHRDSS